MNKNELLERLSTLLERTRAVEFFVPEETGMFSLDEEAVTVRGLVAEAAELMREVMDLYEAEEPDHEEATVDDETDFLREIGAQIASQMAVQEISGLAFVSRGQLLDAVEELDRALAERKVWKIASTADTGLRRAGRALVALESSICAYEGKPKRHRYWQDADDAVAVRRLYGEFRRFIQDTAASGALLAARLRVAFERITEMRELEVYPMLRIDDRLQLRGMRKRIRHWLDQSQNDVRGGEQLWSDLEGFTQLLGHINLRQELLEHDRTAIHRLLERIVASRPGAPISARVAKDLKSLLGRDETLDAIVLEPEARSQGELRETLERLHRILAQPFATPNSKMAHSGPAAQTSSVSS